jgi:hypothetical protein
MIHIIYAYYIIAGILMGYKIGDAFNENHILIKILSAIFWLPELLLNIINLSLKYVWNKDIVLLTAARLFNYNVYKGNKNVNDILKTLNERMIPKWQKTMYGRYCIKGFRHLEKLNNYNYDIHRTQSTQR